MVQPQTDTYNDQGKELREHGTAAFPIACYSGDWKNTSVPLHWHEELEAGFVTAGQVVLTVGKERAVLREGEGFFINRGIPHGFARAEDPMSSQCSVVFDPSIVGGRVDSVFWQRYVQPVLSAASMTWLRLALPEDRQEDAAEPVRQAWEACRSEKPGYELKVRNMLTELMVYLERHRPEEQPVHMRRILRDNERIRLMLSYIQTHFSEELTTADIAASAMISVSEALRCFHNTVGMTPIQCAKNYRIQQAAARIGHTDQKIAHIAAECGFQEMSYFAKSFREIMGVTPSRYRKERQKETKKNSDEAV